MLARYGLLAMRVAISGLAMGLAATPAWASAPQLLMFPAPTSVAAVRDVDPAAKSGEAMMLFAPVQSLIERYGIDGVVRADGRVHKDAPLTAGEAAVMLAATYVQFDTLASGGQAVVQERIDKLQKKSGQPGFSATEAAELNRLRSALATMPAKLTAALLPTRSCVLPKMVGSRPRYSGVGAFDKTGYIDATDQIAMRAAAMTLRDRFALDGLAADHSRFGYARALTWRDVARCLPGADVQPLDYGPYAMSALRPGDTVKRGAFLYALERSAREAEDRLTALIYS